MTCRGGDCRIFELFDTAGAGSISASDLGEAMRAAGATPAEQDIADLSVGKTSFTLDDFKAACAANAAPEQSEVQEAFEVFDQNGNGYISLIELKNVLKNLGEGMDDATLDKVAKASEPDSEGQVNIRHFVDVLHMKM